MNLEGRLIGNRYEIIEKIGNGGMATVYKAKCNVLNRYVAVKVLKEEFTTDEEFIKRFRIEAQAAASLTHPNIVSVYDVGNEGNLYYIVMELIQGKTLKEIIVEDGALSWKWSVNVAIQIASALETAHKNNIVHRDIKPHNIIITEDGIAKVTDFGIAKAVSNSTITTFGATIGSVHYFSPEHARGGYTDAKSDLYSLGIVMYEMLTGRVPFDADTPVSVALKQMQEQPIEPIEINEEIPVSVNNIVLRAMQKDPGLRYANATEMLKDLSRALKDPEGDFVSGKDGGDFPTQTISTMYGAGEKRNQSSNKNKKKQNKFIAFIQNHKKLSIVMGVILLFFLTIGITYFALTAGQLKDVQIPNLVGLSKEEAQKQTEDAKLVYEVQEEKFDPEVPAGYIISQDPPYIENYTIKEKSTIKVVISKGQEIVTVPKVVGKEKEEAVTMLEELGLKVEIVEETSKKVEEGYVIKQSIDEKKEVNSGETITLTVSKGTGIEQVSVPNLVGKTEAEARNLISSAGLSLKDVIEIEDSSKNDGAVTKQSLEAGSTVDKGKEITITVNKLPQSKTGTVSVNVKSLLGGKVYEDEEETKVKKVEVKIVVGDDTIYKEKVEATSTNIKQTFTGIGNVKIKVYIDEVLKKEGTLNLNTSTTYTAD